MSIRIIVDGNTMNESINNNLNMIAALTGKTITAEELKAAMDMQPKSISCVGYEYTRSTDGRVEFVITDEACRRLNSFCATWGPAIAGVLLGFKAQFKAAKKFAKAYIKAHKGLVAGLTDNFMVDGMTEDEWINKKSIQADEFLEKVKTFNNRVVDKIREKLPKEEAMPSILDINPDEIDDLDELYEKLKAVKDRMYSDEVSSESREWDDLIELKSKIRARIRKIRYEKCEME